LGPSIVLGREMKLDPGRASDAIGSVAQQLEFEQRATAAGISRLAELQVAQEIRKLTLSRGYDPREFVLYAYGGAGPLHASAVAAQLGINTVVIPLADAASLWSAFGAACCELGGTYERSIGIVEPFDIELLGRELAALEARARSEIRGTTTDPEAVTVRFAAGLRYRAQVHEVWVDCPAPPLDGPRIDRLITAFEQEYETLFGRGTGYRAAGIEFAALRCVISERTPGFDAVHAADGRGRSIWWVQTGDARPSAVIRGVPRSGEMVAGPAVLELEDTSVLIPPSAVATVDIAGNVVLSLNGAYASPSSPVRELVS
jgi:N-methylhydantoinase A